MQGLFAVSGDGLNIIAPIIISYGFFFRVSFVNLFGSVYWLKAILSPLIIFSLIVDVCSPRDFLP